MPSDDIQHLYEILDQDQVEEQVFAGLRRLLDVLKQHVILCEEMLDPGEYRYRSRDEKISLFGSDTTVGEILDTRSDRFWESKQQLHEVRSILAALAVPRNYDDAYFVDLHVVEAFCAIKNCLQGFWFRCDKRIAMYKVEAAASGTPTPQAEDGSPSQPSSGTCANDAQQRTNKAPQSDHSLIPESSLPPYVKFMISLAPELGVTATKMKKYEVREHIKERWDADTLGDPSEHLLDVMATLMRAPEAQKGRAKPKP